MFTRLHKLCGGTGLPATTDGGGSLPASRLGGDHLGWVALSVFLRIM